MEKLLEVVDFQKEQRINYDQHHIISQRKQLNKNKSLDHQTVEDSDKIANLAYFEENSEVDEDKSNKLTAMAQRPDNPSILNKRSLFETDAMDVDENISHKKIKTHSQGDQTISEEIVS